MTSGTFTTHSPDETLELARGIGEQLTERTLFLLEGDLGAGKTLFAKGLAQGLGLDASEVTSPSFTLVNEHTGRLRMYHIDLYRLGEADLGALGLDEILADEHAITVIEWAERLGATRVEGIPVRFRYVSDTERQITIGP